MSYGMILGSLGLWPICFLNNKKDRNVKASTADWEDLVEIKSGGNLSGFAKLNSLFVVNLFIYVLEFNAIFNSVKISSILKDLPRIILTEFWQIFLFLIRKHSCNSMPFGVAWAYYSKALVLVGAA